MMFETSSGRPLHGERFGVREFQLDSMNEQQPVYLVGSWMKQLLRYYMGIIHNS